MRIELNELILRKFPSQARCAQALNWTRQKLNRIVRGETMPTLDDTEALARVLETPIEEVSEKILGSKSRK